MSFTDHLLLWLHVGFAIFTLGPVAAAMGATPRYIRKRDLPVLRYLYRTTRIFGLLTLGVFLFGLLLGRNDFNQGWLSASMTLFVVAAVLLVLVVRDQHRAIVAIEKMEIARNAAAEAAVNAGTSAAGAAGDQRPLDSGAAGAGEAGAGGPDAGNAAENPTGSAAGKPPGPTGGSQTGAAHLANVERGRIASIGGVISAIWLVILVLMVWHGN
jgi:hypothetical protein